MHFSVNCSAHGYSQPEIQANPTYLDSSAHSYSYEVESEAEKMSVSQ